MAVIDGRRAVFLNAGFGLALQLLLPRPGGMVALWVYDIDEERELVSRLVVSLTLDEARSVAARDPYRVGFLEPIRADMRHPDGHVVLTRFGSDDILAAFPYRVPGDVSEEEFVEGLDSLSEFLSTGERSDPGSVEFMGAVLDEARALTPA